MTVEQLYYTWHQSGRHGRGMYQTFAKSSGFDLLPAATRDLVRELCCYNKPASMAERPDSFGWLDAAESRIAFCRSLQPMEQPGSPETFAAHIVAGPVEELKTSDILESYSLGIWWRGPVFEARQHGPHLPPFDFTGPSRRGSVPSTAIGEPGVGLVEQLLQGRNRVNFQGTAEEAVEALRRVGRTMPALLDGLTFSSFEYGDLEDWFSIVGNAWPPPVQAVDPEAHAAAAYLLSRRGRVKRAGGAGVAEDPQARALERVTARIAEGSSSNKAMAAVPEWPPEPRSTADRENNTGRDEEIQGETVAVSTSRSNTVRRGRRHVPVHLRAAGEVQPTGENEPTTDDAAGMEGLLGDAGVVGSLFRNDPEALIDACRPMSQPVRERAACLVINHLRFAPVSLHAEHAPVLEELITELPLREQVQAWKLILDGEHSLPTEICEAIDRCVAGYFSRMVEDHRLPFCEELPEIIRAVPACWRWAALLGAAPTGQLGSIEDALEAFGAAEYGVASLVAFDVLAVKGPRTPEGMSVVYRLGSVGGVTPPIRALRYLRTGFRHAFHRQRPTALVWSFDQILKNGDFIEPLTGRVGDLLWAMLSNERNSSDTDVLLSEAGSALDWLSTAAPEQARVLMENAPGIYGKAALRWLSQVAKAVQARPARDIEGRLLIPGSHPGRYGIQPDRSMHGGHGSSVTHGGHGSVRQIHRKARLSRRG